VTTTIVNDKGILLLLPPENLKEVPFVPIHERNLFKIQVNSVDQLLVNNEDGPDLNIIRRDIKTFVLNHGRNPKSSESPNKAIVSIKTNRGTSYERYIDVLNMVQGAYYDIYSENSNLTNEGYRSLKMSDPKERAIIREAKNGIPMNISIAEPSN
jgi:biopolymer transport protein ExbD